MEPTQNYVPVAPLAHKSLGRRLRMLRIQKGLTQGDIEKKTGLLRGHVSRLENGHVMPSLETLQRYADALEAPLYMIFYTDQSELTEPREIPDAALKDILEPEGEAAPQQEVDFFRKLKKISARLTDADRDLLLMMAKKLAGLADD